MQTTQEWAIMADKDFEGIEIDTFPTQEAAEAFFRQVIQEALDDDDTDRDDDGRTVDECVEEQVANVGYMRVMIMPAYRH